MLFGPTWISTAWKLVPGTDFHPTAAGQSFFERRHEGEKARSERRAILNSLGDPAAPPEGASRGRRLRAFVPLRLPLKKQARRDAKWRNGRCQVGACHPGNEPGMSAATMRPAVAGAGTAADRFGRRRASLAALDGKSVPGTDFHGTDFHPKHQRTKGAAAARTPRLAATSQRSDIVAPTPAGDHQSATIGCTARTPLVLWCFG
jgi:hypothetical protein